MLQRAFDKQRAAVTSNVTFAAPSGGWVQSGNIVMARPDQAEVLDNFIPTAQGARLRGGIVEYADLAAACVRVFTYKSGATEDFFGSTASGIFDASRVNGTGVAATYADVEGLGSGDWSTVHQTSSAGQFLIAVNGTDYLHYWDGADWNPVTNEAVFDLGFDAETGAFTVGDTVTGGTSGATAEILAITKSSATAGTLRVGAITAGPFQDNEALTDGTTGAATADGASAAGSAVTITNVATTALSQAWVFKERSFFIEKGTTSAWYLPINSIGGAASELDLGSVLNRGGSLLFGATWSLDSGSGLDDVCIFVSTEGEIVVYEGTDPASASTWSLVGVYKVGQPLNKHGWFPAGGDLAILTEDGIISVTEALRKDRAALQASAMTYPIEDAWKDAIANRTTEAPLSVALWQSQTLLVVGTPATVAGQPVAFAANARTGAWGRIVGWDVRCQAIFADELYFGNSSGKIYKADVGGTDDGTAYSGYYVPKFKDMGRRCGALAAQTIYRAPESLTLNMYAHADFQVDDMQVPVPSTTTSGSTWGTFVWGTDVWGSADDVYTFDDWQAVRANGYSMASGMTVTSNQTARINMEILLTRLRFESGAAL